MSRRLLLVAVAAALILGAGAVFVLTHQRRAGAPQAATATSQAHDTSGDLACGLLKGVLDHANGDAEVIAKSSDIEDVTRAAATSTHPSVKAAGAALQDAYTKAQAKPATFAETVNVQTAALRLATECVNADLH